MIDGFVNYVFEGGEGRKEKWKASGCGTLI
jgi:hypothetical protein